MPEQLANTASSKNLLGCHVCLALNHGSKHRCDDCGSKLHSRKPHSIQNTVALLVTSLVLYIPANIYPIMYTTFLGETTPSTILGGVVALWGVGSYPIAVIIFVASVLVPLGKLLALAWLSFSVTYREQRSYRKNHSLYRLTEFIGRWSMVDVFVVAVLVALIQMGNLINILPGIAALAFGLLVITSMFAAFAFDPRLIWEPLNQRRSKALDEQLQDKL